MRKAIEAGDAPDVVAKTVVKAATAAVPEEALCGGKNGAPSQFPAPFRPRSAFDKSLRKQNGLPV